MIEIEPMVAIGAGRRKLSGSSVYLRIPELTDAGSAPVWAGSDFPWPEETARAYISAALKRSERGREQFILVCRRSTDRVVGSVLVRLDGARYARLESQADPLLSDDAQGAIIGEATAIVIAWLFDEYALMTAAVHTTGWHPLIEESLAPWPGNLAYRLREHVLVHGKREDGVVWQVFNPSWISILGAPVIPEVASKERSAIRGIRYPPVERSDRPSDALAVGSRIFFRPFRAGEGKLVARWAMQEPEIYRPHGRAIRTAHNYEAFHSRLARTEPPYWSRFAIADRETGDLIGCTGYDMISWVHRHATSEVEYFRTEHRGMGYGAESSALMYAYGFGTLGLHAINAFVSDANPRSLAATRKRGYHVAGYLAWRTPSQGSIGGYWVLDLLQSEWRNAVRRSLESDPG